jgi:hypothetical protein
MLSLNKKGVKTMTAQKANASMTFNVFVKKDGAMFIAHCLELDIVATGDSPEKVKNDLIDLVYAQIDYAFTHDNLDYLYHPAPKEVWEEFYRCKAYIERRRKIESRPRKDASSSFVPPWIIATFCNSFMADHA